MQQMGHKSSKLALEVYAKRMNRERDTGKRMDALVNGHSMGTNVEPMFAALTVEETVSAI